MSGSLAQRGGDIGSRPGMATSAGRQSLASGRDKTSERHGTGWRGYWENGGVLRFEEEGMKAGGREVWIRGL